MHASRTQKSPRRKRGRGNARRRGEEGYMLVALLALMSLMALMLVAVAPNVRQQAQRERELEAIFRGEEVAQAIRLYTRASGGRLPTSMDQLLEGIPRGTQKIQILRPAAARDPLTNDEWRLVRPGTMTLLDFQRQVMLYAGGNVPPTREPSFQQYSAQMASLVNTGSSESAPSATDDSDSGTGPFIGVTSRSKSESIITYYGINRHNQWVFTPLFR
jgi:type II secretory pathway pseudopilin PulG